MIISSNIPTRKFGNVNVCPNPSDASGTKGSGRSENLKKVRTVGVDIDSASTFGLATKFYVVDTLGEHNEDPSSHKEMIDGIERRISALESTIAELKSKLTALSEYVNPNR